jgi:protein-S-isoprenylcysteine O-methyltransferase Ste14
MDNDHTSHPNASDDDAKHHFSPISSIELGEKLFQWGSYTAVPALMILLLFAHPSARSATVGTLLIILGAVSRVYASAFMTKESQDSVGSDYLIATGPFALIRNPLYLANMIITFGVIFYARVTWLGLPMLILFLFQYYCITKYEEKTLLAKFGDEYQRYMERVPAWIPLNMPVVDDFPIPPDIGAALKSEKTALAAISCVLFLLMLAAH